MAAMYSVFPAVALLAILSPLKWSVAAAHRSGSSSGGSGDGSQAVGDEEIARNIHQFVLHLMACHLTPALTLAVVKDGRVLLANGYGSTSIKEPRAVTSETRFAIGSLTKAFTATLVAHWLHQQPQPSRITFDTPIQSFYPDFRVTDDVRSSQATLRDLLSHRMGLPAYFKALQMGFPRHLTRAELVKNIAYMPSYLSFRDRFVYNNYMYTVAAHLLERMTPNRTWEQLVSETFLLPLNMTSSGFLGSISDFSSFALPCAVINDSITDLSTELFRTVSPCDPAGAIFSNAEDMAKWMNFLLSGGLGPRGQVVVDPQVIRMTLEPSVLATLPFEELTRPKDPVSHVVQSYNMGWATANYRGYRKIYHTGGVVTHFSRLWLYPEVQAGIYINVNGPQEKNNRNSLLESLLYFVSDLLLHEKPWLQQAVVCQLLANLQQSTPAEVAYPAPASQPAVSKILLDSTNASAHNSSDLSQFVGDYVHKCFGTITITQDQHDQQKLVFSFGQLGWMNLTRVSELDFRGLYFGPLSYLNSGLDPGELVRFLRDRQEQVVSLLFSMDATTDLIQFDLVVSDRHGSSYRPGYQRNGGSRPVIRQVYVVSGLLYFISGLLQSSHP